MGGHPYQYLVEYDDDLQAALDRLRNKVCGSGALCGAVSRFRLFGGR